MDRDPDHLLMAAHNAGVYDVASGLTSRESDVRDVPLAGLAAIFADPAAYADPEGWHAAAKRIREENSVVSAVEFFVIAVVVESAGALDEFQDAMHSDFVFAI